MSTGGSIALACLVTLAAMPAHALFEVEFSPEGDFSEAAVQRGVKATREHCDKVDNAVWVDAGEHGEACLKYWAAGFASRPSRRAIIFFHGDVWVGAGRTSKAYLETTNEKLQRGAEEWAAKLAMPYIFFARPGTYGSSGSHMQRRRIGESKLISAAMDELKKRLGIDEFVVAGQSGGGHVTSSLLTHRSDIVCAIPTSAVSSPRVRWMTLGLKRDSTGYTDSYEPTEHLRKDAMHGKVRVFVVGDPKDSNAVWPSQTIMHDKLKETGVEVATLEATGAGPESHSLVNSARVVAGWCARDVSTEEIVRKALEGLRG